MSVDSVHADYRDFSGRWKRCRDCDEGQDAVRAAGETYLPKLTEQEPDDYLKYLRRTGFYNATGRTVDGLSGMIFRVDPMIEGASDEFKKLLNDVSRDNKRTFRELAEDTIRDIILLNRAGVLVDHPSIPKIGGKLTQEQAVQMEMRPFLVTYRAEDILNWGERRIHDVPKKSFVVLQENFTEPNSDTFEHSIVEQIRVLDLDREGWYRQRLFQKNAKGSYEQVSEDVYPLIGGQKFDYIPFEFLPEIAVQVPHLLDLVNVNLSHYRTTADLENAAHLTGLPTPCVAGDLVHDEGSDAKTPLRIGSEVVWQFKEASDAKAWFMEYAGSGLDPLQKLLDRKEQHMAFLGARMLQPDKKAAEAAETAQIHRQGENSVLASIATNASRKLTRVLNIMNQWNGGGEDEIKVTLNADFIPATAEPNLITALVGAWQAGSLTDEENFEINKKLELIPAEKKFEEHVAESEAQGVRRSTGAVEELEDA